MYDTLVLCTSLVYEARLLLNIVKIEAERICRSYETSVFTPSVELLTATKDFSTLHRASVLRLVNFPAFKKSIKNRRHQRSNCVDGIFLSQHDVQR